jgi:hypothetical protein
MGDPRSELPHLDGIGGVDDLPFVADYIDLSIGTITNFRIIQQQPELNKE